MVFSGVYGVPRLVFSGVYGVPRLVFSGVHGVPRLIFSGVHGVPRLVFSGVYEVPRLVFSGVYEVPRLVFSGVYEVPRLVFSGVYGVPRLVFSGVYGSKFIIEERRMGGCSLENSSPVFELSKLQRLVEIIGSTKGILRVHAADDATIITPWLAFGKPYQEDGINFGKGRLAIPMKKMAIV